MFRLLSKFISFIWLFLIVFIFVMFAVENKEKMLISLYPMPYELEVARYAIILISFAVGYFFAILQGLMMVSRQKSITREFRTKAISLENEIKKLKQQIETSEDN